MLIALVSTQNQENYLEIPDPSRSSEATVQIFIEFKGPALHSTTLCSSCKLCDHKCTYFRRREESMFRIHLGSTSSPSASNTRRADRNGLDLETCLLLSCCGGVCWFCGCLSRRVWKFLVMSRRKMRSGELVDGLYIYLGVACGIWTLLSVCR
jgi:hypothetical protein